jgi:hypothetical protein
MRPYDRLKRCRLYAQVCAIVTAAFVAQGAYAIETAPWPSCPSLSAARAAWETHIRELMEQHRQATELNDTEFGNVLSLLYAANSHCFRGDTDAALATSSAIPLGPVRHRLLR